MTCSNTVPVAVELNQWEVQCSRKPAAVQQIFAAEETRCAALQKIFAAEKSAALRCRKFLQWKIQLRCRKFLQWKIQLRCKKILKTQRNATVSASNFHLFFLFPGFFSQFFSSNFSKFYPFANIVFIFLQKYCFPSPPATTAVLPSIPHFKKCNHPPSLQFPLLPFLFNINLKILFQVAHRFPNVIVDL